MKSRLVFRGDDCKEMKSLPATVNMVLYHGMRPNIKVEISDATKAYLQAPPNSESPTPVLCGELLPGFSRCKFCLHPHFIHVFIMCGHPFHWLKCFAEKSGAE